MATPSSKQREALAAVLRRDYATAVRLAHELTGQGNVYGRILLARLHAEGMGVRQDLDLAERLLNEAETLGSAEASYQKAGVFAKRGQRELYFQSIHKAAQAGSLPAKCALGRCYVWGVGVAQDVPHGESVLMDAAAHGSIKARYLLAYSRAHRPRNPLDWATQLGKMLVYGWYCSYLRWVNPTSERLD